MWTSNRKEKQTTEFQQTYFPVPLNEKTEQNIEVDINIQVCPTLYLVTNLNQWGRDISLKQLMPFIQSSDIIYMSIWKK